MDCIIGEGAFATVYQATDPASAEKLVLKVGVGGVTPHVPLWSTALQRLHPSVPAGAETGQSLGVLHKHAAGRTPAALRPPPLQQYPLRPPVQQRECFTCRAPQVRNAAGWYQLVSTASTTQSSPPPADDIILWLHPQNAVNIYKSLSEKVMPQPLVMYFSSCILAMVEQLHAASIIHADIKPDNFLLGDRWTPPPLPLPHPAARALTEARRGALLCLLQVSGERELGPGEPGPRPCPG